MAVVKRKKWSRITTSPLVAGASGRMEMPLAEMNTNASEAAFFAGGGGWGEGESAFDMLNWRSLC